MERRGPTTFIAKQDAAGTAFVGEMQVLTPVKRNSTGGAEQMKAAHRGTVRRSGPVLECDTCQRPFTSSGSTVPRLLPCTHTYCHGCLSELARKGRKQVLPDLNAEVLCIACPRGCGSTPVASMGAAALPINSVLITRLNRNDDVLRLPLCEECDGESKTHADMWCDNCDAYFCKTHFAQMHQTRIGRRHRTMRAADRPPDKFPRCQTHAGQDIVLYCKTCSVPVCRDCCSQPFNGEHSSEKGCTVVPLDAAADEAAFRVRETVAELKGPLVNSLQEAALALQMQLAGVDAGSTITNRDVEETFHIAESNVLAALHQKKVEMLYNLNESTSTKVLALSKQAAEIGEAAAGIITVCGETEAELRIDTTSALRHGQHLMTRLQNARDRAYDCQLTPTAFAAPPVPTSHTALASSLCQTIHDFTLPGCSPIRQHSPHSSP
ncbi:hypothetical protein DIPPA_17501 [Diplonema papillatum]|nr:hypothetical protein DIPPA_17501 [Diplonema papillatum]